LTPGADGAKKAELVDVELMFCKGCQDFGPPGALLFGLESFALLALLGFAEALRCGLGMCS
jgi:hypothetical protein